MLDPNRTRYVDAPLKLAVFDLRFPPQPRLDAGVLDAVLNGAIAERFPIVGPPPMLDITPGSPPRPRGARLTNRARTWSVSFTAESVSIETSRYRDYEAFIAQVEWLLERAHATIGLPGMTRVALRYIDEIQVAGIDQLAGWSGLIHEDLLRGGHLKGFSTREYLATLLVDVTERHRMHVRYGHTTQVVVEPSGPLRINASPSGPFFLLDIDSFWEPSNDAFREFDLEDTLNICLDLHRPIGTLFERATLPALRESFGVQEQA